MLGVVLSDGDVVVQKIAYLKSCDSLSCSAFMKLNITFKACSCSHCNNSDELKQIKRGWGREFIGPYNWESQVVALIWGTTGFRDLDDSTDLILSLFMFPPYFL